MRKFEVVEIEGELFVPLKDFMALKATPKSEIPQKNEEKQPKTTRKRKRYPLCADCGKHKGEFTYQGSHGNKVCGRCLRRKQNGTEDKKKPEVTEPETPKKQRGPLSPKYTVCDECDKAFTKKDAVKTKDGQNLCPECGADEEEVEEEDDNG